MYNGKTMARTGCFVRTPGNIYTQAKVIREWREAGLKFQRKIFPMKIRSMSVLQVHLSSAVRETALNTMFLWRSYTGNMKGGIFKGFIYGSLLYD
jgi:hypothetical protein